MKRTSSISLKSLLQFGLGLSICAVEVFSDVTLDCDPCIERPSYKIKAIVHGTKKDGFWQQVRNAAIQSGKDMRVDLDFDLYDNFDVEKMASDILEASKSSDRPDALIVTIPAPEVEQAIKDAADSIPIFGMNSGYDKASDSGVLGFVSMDDLSVPKEFVGGSYAAKEFLSKGTVAKALFINYEKGNAALDQRYRGFAATLRDAVNTTNETTTMEVEELVIDLFDGDPSYALSAAFEGCPYDAILLAGGAALEATTSAYYEKACDLSSMQLGTFDTSKEIFDAIAVGKLQFGIGQQQALQGAFSVVLAAIYATTGKTIASSSESKDGVYFSGPKIINLSTLPSDTFQSCEAEAFPVCQAPGSENDVSPGGSACPCTDRSKITIGGVLHGVTIDSFWDIIFEQAAQAADDLGVNLLLDRLEPQPTPEVWQAKMASKMISLCQEGVDGLFVTIPGDGVVAAIEQCKQLNVPVISVNSGADTAEELGLIHHLSQLEYPAGRAAAKAMIDGGMKEAVCLNTEAGNIGVIERCRGFKDVVDESNQDVTYLAEVVVTKDMEISIKKALEDAVGRAGDWEGVGILNNGPTTAKIIIELKKDHPSLISGTFDLGDTIYEGLDKDVFMFGIDQNPFMQGYLPVWLLTLFASNKQHLINTFVETGPTFVEESPSTDLQQCSLNHFEVCPRPEIHNRNQIDKIRPFGFTLGGIAIVGSLFFMAWSYVYRNDPVVKKSQPVFLGMVCLGTLLMATTIIPLSVDDSIASQEACNRACMAVPWLFTLGFTTSFSALFSKIWRINKLIKGAKQFKRLRLEATDVLLPYFLLLALNVLFMLIWNILDPMYWKRTVPEIQGDGLTSYGRCEIGKEHTSIVIISLLTGVALLVIVLANMQAYKARKLETEFSESKYIAMIMVAFLQVILLGIPYIVLVASNPVASYFVKVTITFAISFSMLLGIFVPKMFYLGKISRKSNKKSSSQSAEDSGMRIVCHPSVTNESSSTPIVLSDNQVHTSQIVALAEKLKCEESELKSLLHEFGLVRSVRTSLVESEKVRIREES